MIGGVPLGYRNKGSSAGIADFSIDNELAIDHNFISFGFDNPGAQGDRPV